MSDNTVELEWNMKGDLYSIQLHNDILSMTTKPKVDKWD